MTSKHRLPRAAAAGALAAAMLAAPAIAASDSTTLAEIAMQNGWNPDDGDPPNMDTEIPRDFPVPAGTHDLSASNAVPFAGVTDVPPDQADDFYTDILPKQGWSIDSHIHLPGMTAIVACNAAKECVNLASQSAEQDPDNPDILKLHFFPDTD